jgi:hypothetical protein
LRTHRRLLLLALAAISGAGAFAASLADAPAPIPDLIVLSAALVVAEQFELRPTNRAPLPLSFAVAVVLVRAADLGDVVALFAIAFAVAVAARTEPRGSDRRLLLYGERLAEAGGAAVLFHLAVEWSGSVDAKLVVIGALAAAATFEIVVADIVTWLREHRVAPLRERGADLALVTSATLMAVGYRGIDGVGSLGLWGPLLFSIPLLAAWYSFDLLGSTRRNLHQTVEALGLAPELAGLVSPGHGQRVAELATEVGVELGMPEQEIEQLETAALLHHLGAVSLDAPESGGQLDPRAVADAGAEMLRGSEVLAPAGDIVAAEPLLHRPPDLVSQPEGSLSGQVLKVASAFDELTDGRHEHAAWALEALYTGPLYVYDGRVVGALERVLERRGALPDRA